MKKNLLLLFCSFFAIQLFAGSIDILGVNKQIDTLEYKIVGPGITYAKLSLPEYPLSVYTLVVDLNNQYNFIETFQAGNQVGKTEAMTSAYTRLDAANHRTIAGVNGNFWTVSGQNQPTELLGVPYSGSSMKGEMITMPSSWNRGRTTDPELLLQEIGFATIDRNKTMLIDDVGFDGKVIVNGVGNFPISEINRIRYENQIVFFNQFMGTLPTRSDDTGIEVFLKPLANEAWNINDTVECEVVRIIRDKGANVLEAGEVALSGAGTGRTFLENLEVGQTVKINMGVYTLKDNIRPQISEMVTGNALVMKDGVLTIRNTNEAYNSQLYPRTGIGMSQDGKKLYLIVIDKSTSSVGASTSTMCGILKASGAWNATTMDGGGSAQMMLEGSIVNKPADGKERAVSNGWFVYHNAPEDNEITQIEFADYKVEIPVYASYHPRILGYNKYGVLIVDSLSDFTLTCDNNLGEILDGTNFIAASSVANGLLTAHYNNIEVSKPVNVIGAEIFFRLDSVLIDNSREYSVQVQSVVGSNSMDIMPSALSWAVSDPTVCSIENGILKGLKNGKTMVIGELGDFRDTLKVTVEIPEAGEIVGDDFNSTNWTLDASSALNAVLNTQNLPTEWTGGSAVNFVYVTTRAPYIKLIHNVALYSLPDTIKVKLNIGDISISRVIVSLRANNSAQYITKEFTNLTQNSETQISLPTSSLFDSSDIAIFPIWFNYLNFYLNSQTANQSYTLAMKEIALCYKGFEISGTPSVLLSKLSVYPNPVNGGLLQIRMENNEASNTNVELLTISGASIRSREYNTKLQNEIVFPIDNLTGGTYLIKVTQGEKTETVKIMIN